MNRIIALWFARITLLVLPVIAFGEQPKGKASDEKTDSVKVEPKQPFTVLVVDPNGKPVADALVGKMAGRDGEVGSEWVFAGFIESGKWHPFITDASGKTQMDAENISRESLALVARKASRKLVGLKPVTKKEVTAASTSKSEIVISLEPECRVHGRLQCTGLEKVNRKLTRTNANLEIDGRRVFECSSSDQEYEFFVPQPQITDASLSHITKLPKLEYLEITASKVSSDSLARIVKLPKLVVLTIDSPSITDGDLECLAMTHELFLLTLNTANVTDSGLTHLEKMTNLKRVILRGTKVTAQGESRLRQALPDCLVNDVWGF
jgi:hypothetical protein